MKATASRSTFDDANLILRLYDLRREDRMRQARAWFSASFKPKTFEVFTALCPPGSEANASYRMVISYWEMVASFLTSGVLQPELFYQSGREMLVVWVRVRDLIPKIRETNGNPLEFTNLEAAATGFIEWWNQTAPGAFDRFEKRVRG